MNLHRGRIAVSRINARLPLRVRLVAGFALAMAVLLTAAGAFVYWRVAADLDRGLDRTIAEQHDALLPLIGADGHVQQPATADAALAAREYQTLTADGQVLSSGSGVSNQALLSPSQLARAQRGPIRVQVGNLLPGSRRPLRLVATPVDGAPGVVLVVGVLRNQRDEALRELLAQLAIAGLGALIIAAVVGERLAKAALTPVERYRAQAESIAAGATGVRLDVPATRDDEITRLGRTFNDVLGSLEAALARERRFVNDASHELRTPLTLLKARVQLQRRRPRSIEEHEQALAELEADISDLVALTAQLLELGTAREASLDDGPVRTDVCETVEALSLPELGICVHAAPTDTIVTLPANPLRQAIINLVANARIHGRTPIDLTVRRADDEVVITVTDAGDGIPADFLAHATERFHRADDARARPGAGLGLALVHTIVGRGHGELRLCSNGVHHRFDTTLAFACEHPSAGTTATVALPAVASATVSS
jgi:signal transduction histidine kinase